MRARVLLRYTDNLSAQPTPAASQPSDQVAALADAIVIVDAAGSIVEANSVAERMFGYSRDELLHLRVEALMPAAFRAGHEVHRSGYAIAPRHRRMGTRGRFLRFGMTASNSSSKSNCGSRVRGLAPPARSP